MTIVNVYVDLLVYRGLVAITERYFTPNYFDKWLTGARADQEVLKELIGRQLPTVHRHLHDLDVELATITLNWFLAMFFDAVPFQVLHELVSSDLGTFVSFISSYLN